MNPDKPTSPANDAQIAPQLEEATPEFLAAMSECLCLLETRGMNHPDTLRAMQRAMSLTPPSTRSFLSKQARKLGLLPEADGYTDDGLPVYSLESIAAKLDVGMDKAKEAMQVMLLARELLGLPAVLVDPATIHRKH